jgi:hypothetical protein
VKEIAMTNQLSSTGQSPQKALSSGKASGFERLLTPNEAADRLRVSLSWLAKARMRGDGPPFIKVRRSIRYSDAALAQWIRANQRLSTSES